MDWLLSWERHLLRGGLGRFFDSTLGYPGEGPTSAKAQRRLDLAMNWINEDKLDLVEEKETLGSCTKVGF